MKRSPMKRKLLDGREEPEFDIPITLQVKTKCPGKYKLIDMETGQVYIGNVPVHSDDLHWRRIED